MTSAEPKVSVQRNISAARSVVFEGWTDAQVLGKWLIPEGCTVETASVDAKLGGSYRFVISVPNSESSQILSGEYREFVPSERIVKTWILCDDCDDPAQAVAKVLTADFEEGESGTRLEVTHEGEVDPMIREHLRDILNHSLEKLGNWAETRT